MNGSGGDDFDAMHRKMMKLRLGQRQFRLTPAVQQTLRDATRPRRGGDSLLLTSSTGLFPMKPMQRVLYRKHWRMGELPVERDTEYTRKGK